MGSRADLSGFRRGIDQARSQIVQAAKTELRLVGLEIEQGSRARAPELTGQLLDSHKTESAEAGSGFRVAVSAGPAFNPMTGEEYAVTMHEGFPGRPDYGLGPISEKKNTGTPHTGEGVGRKFMERAFDSIAPTIPARIAAALRRLTGA